MMRILIIFVCIGPMCITARDLGYKILLINSLPFDVYEVKIRQVTKPNLRSVRL